MALSSVGRFEEKADIRTVSVKHQERISRSSIEQLTNFRSESLELVCAQRRTVLFELMA